MSKLVPAGLIALALVPSAVGVVRLGEFASGTGPSDNPPAPVIVHIVAVLLYSLLGAFQFDSSVRRQHPSRHRRAGRVVVVAGLAVAASGAWMTLAYDLPSHDGVVVNAARLVVAAVMAAGLVLAVAAIRRRDVRRHRAWMIRAYALALGAGTQAFTLGGWTAFAGQPGTFARAVLMILAWLINVAVAEWVIVRGAARASRAGRHPGLAR
ncbi:DUF2306 domain-containing protein [Actinoplanes solisilvae]|uniref:DUF2306 domain-containing protein n=1 Tax=Actinoplanes solisilvae TaxID=2486853 RepID=UPI000FD6C324|nr:DUF2306 domain-containing protein [Actinoplanes solisilvae]